LKRIRYVLAIALLALVVPAAPTLATHHQMEIREVFLGTFGGSNEDAQFIELRTKSSGQQFVDGHQVKFFNAAGTLVETATFSNNADSASGSNAAILAATEEAEILFGVTADVEFDAQNTQGGGKVCFESTTFGIIDCVAWGNYTGPSTGAGAPFSPGEGIPLGAAIQRTTDSNVSKNDFNFVAASPDGGAAVPNALKVIQFNSATYTATEGNPAAPIVIRSGTGSTQVVDFGTLEGTADEGDDFTDVDPDPKVQFSSGDTQKTTIVATTEDSEFEGSETVRLRVRNPTAQALLGPNLNATLTINDDDPDPDPPKSRINKPKNNSSHNADDLLKFKGTANDGLGTVNEIGIALRRTLNNGKCQWLALNWAVAPCGDKTANKAIGTETWKFPLGEKLKKSTGTNVKFYTVYSSADDLEGNVETIFKKGRNANKFEVT
jgi:Calx-beta domain